MQEIDKRALAVRERGNVLTLLDALRAWEAEYSARGRPRGRLSRCAF